MNKVADKYESALLADILSEITPQEQLETDRRMLQAVKITEAMKRKELKDIDLAKLMDKNPSVIAKWLSGTHHLGLDIINKLEHHLEIRL